MGLTAVELCAGAGGQARALVGHQLVVPLTLTPKRQSTELGRAVTA